MQTIRLDFTDTLMRRLREASPRIQVVLGPRQVGKTTGMQQVLSDLPGPSLYSSADKTIATPSSWLLEQWQSAKRKGSRTVLAIDEIQKIDNWSETIKRLWDAEPEESRPKLVLVGSSSLHLQAGLTESLAGRFELITVCHWNFFEHQAAFGWGLREFLLYGGYPGAAEYISNFDRWYAYIKNSIVETVIGKDILEMKSVAKPALFRQAFEILCSCPAQEISLTKMLGQLQDKGNTDLVKRYIELYEGAFLFKALFKFSNKRYLTKSSSPKILPMCPALVTLQQGDSAFTDPRMRGRLTELVVGTELARLPGTLSYWRSGKHEVDYIYEYMGRIYAIEVKSARTRSFSGLAKFLSEFPGSVPIVVTESSLIEFLEDVRGFLEHS